MEETTINHKWLKILYNYYVGCFIKQINLTFVEQFQDKLSEKKMRFAASIKISDLIFAVNEVDILESGNTMFGYMYRLLC